MQFVASNDRAVESDSMKQILLLRRIKTRLPDEIVIIIVQALVPSDTPQVVPTVTLSAPGRLLVFVLRTFVIKSSYHS